MQVTAIKLNYIVLLAAISSAQSNLGADLIAPARRSFKKGYWSLGPRPTTRGDGEGRGRHMPPPQMSSRRNRRLRRLFMVVYQMETRMLELSPLVS